MDVYAIANREGKTKHVAVYHKNAYGPSALCHRRAARPAWDANNVRDESVLIALDPSELERPWCRNCENAVEAIVRAVSHG